MRTPGSLLVGALLGAALTAAGFLWAGARSATVSAGDPDPAAAEGGPPHADLPDGEAPATHDGAGGSVLRSSAAPATPAEREFLATALREERRRRIASAIGGEDSGLGLLHKVFDEHTDPAPLVESFDRVASHVSRSTTVALKVAGGDGVTRISQADAAKAVVIELGPGVFEFQAPWPRWGGGPPTDVEALEIRGAGADRTTVRGPGGSLIYSTGRLGSLRLKGLTWDGGRTGGRVAQLEGDTAVVVEECRFVGDPDQNLIFFHLAGRTLIAFRDCTFDARSLLSGSVLHLNGDVVAQFERCTFRDLAAVIGATAGAVRDGALEFRGCRFEAAPLVYSSGILYRGKPAISLRLSGCSVGIGGPAATDEQRRTIFGASFAASLEDVGFAADPAWPTVATVLELFEKLVPPDGRKVLGAHLLAPEREGFGSEWRVDLWSPTLGAEGRRANGRAGTYGVGAAAGGNNFNTPLPDDQKGSIDWRSVLRGVPLDGEATGFVLGGAMSPPPDSRWAPAILIENRRGQGWAVEVPSGRVLSRPPP